MPTPTERWILHADMDAFYASVEQRDRPELRGRPVIVGATSARGVVAAASYEARRYGVHSAMPAFEARRLCPDGIYLPSDMPRYASVSREVHAAFREFTPVIEPLSLDEAFLDVTGSSHLFGGAEALGRALKRAVLEATGLSVSVGLAPNKLVAKIACTLGKPDGLEVVARERVRALMDPLPVGRLWGVGRVLEQRLVERGILTLAQLSRAEPDVLRALVGRRADELRRLAAGDDERPVESQRGAKSLGEENTFEADVTDARRIAEVIVAHSEAVARRLRRAGLLGRTVTVKVKLARAAGRDERGPRYPLHTRSKTLPEGTDDALRISSVARALWLASGVERRIRLLGVSVSGLSPRGAGAGTAQLGLFDAGARTAAERARSRPSLGPTLDAITERFGGGAIRRAVESPGKITHGSRLKAGEDYRDLGPDGGGRSTPGKRVQ